MTKKEAIEFLTNTKVYVKNKSREIQAKLFSLGFKWNCSECREIHNTDKPFLFIYGCDSKLFIKYSKNVEWFNNHTSKEITPEDILNITIDEPKYRPFKDAKECWEEMLKHQPFGWLKDKVRDCYIFLNNTSEDTGFNFTFNHYVFADGTPFGIKEDLL